MRRKQDWRFWIDLNSKIGASEIDEWAQDNLTGEWELHPIPPHIKTESPEDQTLTLLR